MQGGISRPIQRLCYDLDVRGFVVLFLAGAIALSLLESIQTGSETHVISYSKDTGCSLARGKEIGAQSSPFTLSSAKVKRLHTFISTFPYEFMTCTVQTLPAPLHNFKLCISIVYFLSSQDILSHEKCHIASNCTVVLNDCKGSGHK
jgi:hypothetical protein